MPKKVIQYFNKLSSKALLKVLTLNLTAFRFRETGSAECSNRVVRLMQAKSLKKTERSRMIDIIYTKEPTGDQNIDVRSFFDDDDNNNAFLNYFNNLS